MAVIGKPRTFHKKFKFLVEIDGFVVAKFTKAGPIEAELTVVEQNEGGALIPVKELGKAKVTNITLERGVTDNQEIWDWFELCADLAANSGEIDDKYKKNLDIVQLDRNNQTLRRWRCFGCFPVKFNAGEWDNDADENVMESAELAYDYPKLIKVA